MNSGGGVGGRYSRRTCGKSWRGHQHRKKKKKEQNELAISSQARPVTHLAGPPIAWVSPWYITLIQQKKAGPHPSEEGRGSHPQCQVEEEDGGGGGGGRQED